MSFDTSGVEREMNVCGHRSQINAEKFSARMIIVAFQLLGYPEPIQCRRSLTYIHFHHSHNDDDDNILYMVHCHVISM